MVEEIQAQHLFNQLLIDTLVKPSVQMRSEPLSGFATEDEFGGMGVCAGGTAFMRPQPQHDPHFDAKPLPAWLYKGRFSAIVSSRCGNKWPAAKQHRHRRTGAWDRSD